MAYCVRQPLTLLRTPNAIAPTNGGIPAAIISASESGNSALICAVEIDEIKPHWRSFAAGEPDQRRREAILSSQLHFRNVFGHCQLRLGPGDDLLDGYARPPFHEGCTAVGKGD